MFEHDIVIPGLGVITADARAPRGTVGGIEAGCRPLRVWPIELDPSLRDWLGQRIPANEAAPGWHSGGPVTDLPNPTSAGIGTFCPQHYSDKGDPHV